MKSRTMRYVLRVFCRDETYRIVLKYFKIRFVTWKAGGCTVACALLSTPTPGVCTNVNGFKQFVIVCFTQLFYACRATDNTKRKKVGTRFCCIMVHNFVIKLPTPQCMRNESLFEYTQPQNEYMDLHRKRHGRRFDYEKRKCVDFFWNYIVPRCAFATIFCVFSRRKMEARMAHSRAKHAQRYFVSHITTLTFWFTRQKLQCCILLYLLLLARFGGL